MALIQPRFKTLEEARKDLAKRNSAVSIDLLRAWIARGLLPKHQRVEGLGRGKGVKALYPASIVDLAQRIVEMRKQGIPEAEIRQHLEAQERQFALELVHKYLSFHTILSPEAHARWFQWANEVMVEKVIDWKLTADEKEQRMKGIAANHVREFRLILDAVEARLIQRLGTIDGPLRGTLDELRSEIEAKISEYPREGGDLFRVTG